MAATTAKGLNRVPPSLSEVAAASFEIILQLEINQMSSTMNTLNHFQDHEQALHAENRRLSNDVSELRAQLLDRENEIMRLRKGHEDAPVTKAKPLAGDPRFHAVLAELATLHGKKVADYGTGQDCFANVRGSAAWGIDPWLGVALRMGDKMKRLQSFAVNGRLENEGVEDSLLDLASYSIISLVLFREHAT